MISRSQVSVPGLAIGRIRPVDVKDPEVGAAVAAAAEALARPHLREILAFRTAVQQFLCTELAGEGYVHPPIYMLSGCTDPLNHQTWPARLDYYGDEISVTQSLILQKLLLVMLSPADRVFWASPNIRMEMGVSAKGHKYASEFMQVDFEQRGMDMGRMMAFIGRLVARMHRHLNETCGDILREIRGELLPEITTPLAIHDLADVKFSTGLESDDAVERHLAERSGGLPFLVTNLRREAYDCRDGATGRFLNYDVVYPAAGAGSHPVECLSGAERTRSLADLRERMIELEYPVAYFEPFFEVFRAAGRDMSAPITCAGGGFGVERLTYALLGLADIHQVYPLPRPAEGRIAV